MRVPTSHQGQTKEQGKSTPQEGNILSSHEHTMEDNTNKSLSPLLHVHICVHCSAVFRREQVEGRVHTTGLFICSNCGKEGPLNIEICEINDGVARNTTVE